MKDIHNYFFGQIPEMPWKRKKKMSNDLKIDWKYLMSLTEFERLKYLLSLEIKVNDICIGVSVHSSKNNPYIPKNRIDLQFCGYAITLNEDGTWYWEDTSGG